MDMKNIHSGKLRAIGFDATKRVLQVQLDNGDTLQYDNVSSEIWRRFAMAASPWSFYRDNIEEEMTARRVSSRTVGAGANPLDTLFRQD